LSDVGGVAADGSTVDVRYTVLVDVLHDGTGVAEADALEDVTGGEAGGGYGETIGDDAGDEAGGGYGETTGDDAAGDEAGDEYGETTGEEAGGEYDETADEDEDDKAADEVDETVAEGDETTAAAVAAEVDVPKISFCAPIVISDNVSNDNQRIETLTILESTFAIVRRALRVTAQVIAGDRDVVSLSLIPDQNLFGALNTFTLVVLAPDGRFGGGNRGSGGSASNHALETLHVDVRLTAPIRDLEDMFN
jgi:hypothetical protein